MKTHNCIQGSKKWLDLRASVDGTASEIPAVMGESKYQTRDELLRIKVTGESKPVDKHLQSIFDKGHAAEASIRPHIEEIVGDDLFNTTATEVFDGLTLLASFDGITFDETIVFEHKLWNEGLADYVLNKDLPLMYALQVEQQLMVSGAEKAIFVVSDGTPDKMVYMWYKPDLSLRPNIISAWKQFKIDLDSYEHKAETVKPVAADLMELPTLDIQIHGGIKNSNLATYKQSALDFIKNINTDLKTDSDFAVAEKTVKFCGEAEKRIDLVKKQALSQTADIEKIFDTLDQLKSEMRTKRLSLEKLVKAEKVNVKTKIIQTAKSELAKFLTQVNSTLDFGSILESGADFKTATKGLKTIESFQSKVNDEIARVKIEINAKADKVRLNVKSYNDLAEDYKFLFHDINVLANEENNHFVLLVNDRINKHKEAEKAKADALREKIREEEETKAAEKLKETQPEEVPPVVEEEKSEPVKTTLVPKKVKRVVAKTRPTDLQLIECIAEKWNVTNDLAIVWLLDMDLREATIEVSKSA